jgi:DNA-binding HxlR family transcriptional regulator
MIGHVTGASSGEPVDKDIPEFEFDVWASPPSREVYALSSERIVQQILYSIEEEPLSLRAIADRIHASQEQIEEKLDALAKHGLIQRLQQGWISNIPLYTQDEMRASEEISAKYAEEEARIILDELPKLKTTFEKTALSAHFSWDEVSLIIVGALLADFCVVDRIPFLPDYYAEELQPSLISDSGKRWAYDGFEKLPRRFPSRKWKFYQNVLSKYSGGLARFGFVSEKRAPQPSRPEGWMRFEKGKILLALAEGPQTFESLKRQTGLIGEILTRGLEELRQLDPPAVVLSNDTYRSEIPVLCEADLDLLLGECDRIASIIFDKIVRPHFAERAAKGKASGSRWPLPADTYVRDRALQILIENGHIGPSPKPEVNWECGFWGWRGFLRMHDEITDDVRPDPFLHTPITDDEAARIAHVNALKDRVLAGKAIVDISTPAMAYVTWISAYANSGVAALKEIELPADHVDMEYLENRTKRGWLEYIGKVNVRRLPPVPAQPQEGDVSAVFTMHERGFEEAYVFFHYARGWRYLGNTARDGRWHTWAENSAKEKIKSLKKQSEIE